MTEESFLGDRVTPNRGRRRNRVLMEGDIRVLVDCSGRAKETEKVRRSDRGTDNGGSFGSFQIESDISPL